MHQHFLFLDFMISQRSISLILESANIVEVIGEYVRLKRVGSNYAGLCPFHNEKTPSFNVSPSRGIYKCFGCGAAGNVSKFLMEHEHFSYPEALRYLAEKYRIEIEEIRTDKPEDKAGENLKESLMVANGFAQKFYSDILFHSDDGKAIGLSYFTERGFREDTIKKFQLGFAPKAEDAFYNEAKAKSYNEEILKSAGLITERGNRKVDFFRERVMFPIHNFSGRVIGFGGRILTHEKGVPKYINTPQTPIYDKSKTLYGIFFAKNSVRKNDECILVEGYTDVISLSQAGIENVVASSGTSLTAEQAKLIRRMTQNVTILYDGDSAGLKAALRGIDILLEEDLNVRVIALPEPEDPDSFVRTHGALALQEYIAKNKSDFILFKTKLLLCEIGNDPYKKAEAIKDIVTSIAIIPDAIKRSLLLKECSFLLSVDEQILISETNKIKRNKFSREANISSQEVILISHDAQPVHDQRTSDHQQNFELQERDIIRLLLEYGNELVEIEYEGGKKSEPVLKLILEDLQGITLENPLLNRILEEFAEGIKNEKIPDQNYFIHHPQKEICDLAIGLLYSPYEISPNWYTMHDIVVTDKRFIFRQDIRSSMSRFKLKRLLRMIDECQQKAKQAKDEEEIDRCLRKLHRYQVLKKELANDLGTVVLR
ncbi:MAG TPA: DNA primase [Chitinophagales bacterium]|nr:DNA primase [Chitinophagales bacterium]